MKKIAFFLSLILLSFQINAQTKIKKSDIIGKWVLAVEEFKNIVTYDLDKDSIIMGDSGKANLSKANISIDSATKSMRPAFEIMRQMFYQFNEDGTGEIYYGQGPASDYKISYIVDEESSTITTTDRHKKNEAQKIYKLKDKLLLITIQTPQNGGMEIWSTLKKVQ